MAKRWTEKELEFIEKYVNILTLNSITERLNKRNANSGIKRSKWAIANKLRLMGYSVVTTEDNMTSFYWAEILGIPKLTVEKWIKKYGLCGIKGGVEQKARYYISKKAMLEFAKKNPYRFSSIKKDILLYYFGGKLTDIILSYKAPKYSFNSPQKIKQTKTGEIYSSLKKASQQLGISRHSVKVQAQRNGWLKFV